MFAESLDEQLVAEVVDALRLTHQIVEVVVRAPLAARNFHPGEFYRLQNYETLRGGGRRHQAHHGGHRSHRGLGRSRARPDLAIVLEMGGSSRLCSLLEPGEKVVLMGPTGTPTEIPHDQTVVLAGGGPGQRRPLLHRPGAEGEQQPGDLLRGLPRSRRPVQTPRDRESLRRGRVEHRPGPGIAARRPQDRTFHRQHRRGHASLRLGPSWASNPIPLADAQRIIAIGSDRMMAAVKTASPTRLQPLLSQPAHAIGSINSPMQCMMKEICAQCLQRHVDPETKKESFVFSCFNQDQLLESVDFAQPEHPARARTARRRS